MYYIRTRSPLFYHRTNLPAPMWAGSHNCSRKSHHHDVERRRHACRHRNSACRVAENDQELRLSLDVPGIKINDLSVEIKDGILHVSGKREGYPDTSKLFRIDNESVDIDKMEAKLTHGVLELKAPKKAKSEARTIPIVGSSHNGSEAMQEVEVEVSPPHAEAIALAEESEKIESHQENEEEEIVVETVPMEDDSKESNTEGWEEVAPSKEDE